MDTSAQRGNKVFQDAYRVTKFLEFLSNSQKPKQIDIEFWGPSSTYPSGIECELKRFHELPSARLRTPKH